MAVPQGATGFGVGVEVGTVGLEIDGVFLGIGEGGSSVAVGWGFAIAVADGSIGVKVGVGGSGEGMERATTGVVPSKVGVEGEGLWAAFKWKGSTGKRSQAAREPKRRAVRITTTPTPPLKQPLSDLTLFLSKKRCGAALLPHTCRLR